MTSATPDSHTDSAATPFPWLELALVLFFMLLGGVLRLWQPDLAYFNLHTARDLYRTLLLVRGEEFPLLGSELQYGGRVLGPLMYLLCAIPLAIHNSPVSIAYVIGVLNTLLIPVVWLLTRRYFGRGIGVWAAGLYAFFPLEIVQLRFLWNPCFFPAMLYGALWGMWRVTVDRKPWHLVTMVFFLGLALQLHFSALEAIFGAALILIVARVRIPWKVVAASVGLFLLMFSPAIINELKTERSNVATIVEAPDSARKGLERYTFNPHGFLSFMYHTRVEMDEKTERLGFTYLEAMAVHGGEFMSDGELLRLDLVETFGQWQMLFWVLGMLVCVQRVVQYYRTAGGLEPDDRTAARGAMIPYLTCFLWQLIPVFVMSFFNFHGRPGDPPAIAPIRYFLVSYPMPYVASAIGIITLAALLTRAGRAIRKKFSGSPHGWPLGGVIYLLAGLLIVGQAYFSFKMIQLFERSGRSVVYTKPNVVPNLRTMLEIRDVLLGEAGVTRDAFYERVHHQQLSNKYLGESTFDWLITQDPRSVTNPEPPANRRWLLHSPLVIRNVVIRQKPDLPGYAKVLRTWKVGAAEDMSIIEYEVDRLDWPLPTPPPHIEMRNHYFQDRRMMHLGPDPELRKRGRE
jgi:hypothetical protein